MADTKRTDTHDREPDSRDEQARDQNRSREPHPGDIAGVEQDAALTDAERLPRRGDQSDPSRL